MERLHVSKVELALLQLQQRPEPPLLQSLPPREVENPCGGEHRLVFVAWCRCDGWHKRGNTCRDSDRIKFRCRRPT